MSKPEVLHRLWKSSRDPVAVCGALASDGAAFADYGEETCPECLEVNPENTVDAEECVRLATSMLKEALAEIVDNDGRWGEVRRRPREQILELAEELLGVIKTVIDVPEGLTPQSCTEVLLTLAWACRWCQRENEAAREEKKAIQEAENE